jgi:hypothetical protein
VADTVAAQPEVLVAAEASTAERPQAMPDSAAAAVSTVVAAATAAADIGNHRYLSPRNCGKSNSPSASADGLSFVFG